MSLRWAAAAGAALLLGLLGSPATSAHAATLYVGSGELAPGQTLVIPVVLEAGTDPAPAALAFTLTYGLSPLVVVDVEAGAVARTAAKGVSWFAIDGGAQILVGGVNENSLADGELVRVSLRLVPPTDPGNLFPIQGMNGSAAAVNASAVPVALVEGQILSVAASVPVPPLGGAILIALLLVSGIAFLRYRERAAFLSLLLLLLLWPNHSEAWIAGDLDDSGNVTTADLAEMAVSILEGSPPPAADLDASGTTDAVDYQMLVRILLGDDLDADDDGLTDVAEGNLATDPNNPDTDDDDVSDGDEHFDTGTSPLDADSDDDGLSDGDEVIFHATDPNDADSDDDGLSDGDEILLHNTNPNDSDSDDDGLSDGDEVNTHSTNPNDSDTDDDGVDDGLEVDTYGSDPNDSDTDDDGVNDADEVAAGTDPTVADPNVWINEFMADNATVLQDEDNNYSDWIELYNPGSFSIDLNDWSLTDDAGDLEKWKFPAVSIGAQSYLVVFASGLNRTPTDGSNLHTSFGLSKNGEYLALVAPDGVSVASEYSPEFPAQVEDLSYGLLGSEERHFSTPTPGAQNDGAYLGLLQLPTFSEPHGIQIAPFLLTLTSVTPGAEIRYTLDSTVPTATTGIVYQDGNPLTIATTSVVRAAVFKPGYLSSVSTTNSYIFPADVITQPALPSGFSATWGGSGSSNIEIDGDYEMDPEIVNDPAYSGMIVAALSQLPIISVAMPEPDWFSTATGIISNSAVSDNPGWVRAASAELMYPDGSPGFQINAGVRVVGGSSSNSSFKTPKHSLRLKFTSEYGPTRLETQEPILPGTHHTSFNTLVLDAGINLTWYHISSSSQRRQAQYVRDQYVNDLQNLLDGLSPHGFFAHVYRNGLYWGMYYVHERPDAEFMSDYLGGDPEEFDVIKHEFDELVSGSIDGYGDMLDLVRSGVANDGTYQSLISQYLDLGPYTNYMLLNFWAGNTDWDRHNWYVGRNRNDGSLFRYYSWDAEHVLKDDDDDQTDENRVGAPSEIHQLLKSNEDYVRQFGDRAHKLLKNGGLFTEFPATAVYDLRANEVMDPVVTESARWGDHIRDHRDDSAGAQLLHTRDDHWIPELDRLHDDYFPVRADIVIGQLRAEGVYPDLDAPSFNIAGSYQHGGSISNGAVLTMDNPNSSGTLYYTLDGTDPRAAGESFVLFSEDAAKRVFVPTGDIGSDWRTQSTFDDSAWTAGTGGVGYDQNSGFDPFVNIDIELAMHDVNTTAYIRIRFDVDADELAAITSLTLRIRYDDGFGVYVNGAPAVIAADNEPGTLVWNSESTAKHPDSQAIQFVDFDVSSALGTLQLGGNFLAVQLLNSSISNSDVLFSAELIGSTSSTAFDISPNAIDYSVSQPAPLTDTVRVLARVLDSGDWSALNDANYQIDTADYSELRITELMYNPAPEVPLGYWGNDDFEFIEIKNIGAKTLDLTGVKLDKGVHFSFNDSNINPAHLLGPGEYIVVASDALAFRARYGDSIYLAGRYFGRLDNGGEAVRLADPAGTTIVEFTYNNSWYQTTDGEGFSLTALDEAAPPEAWDDSSAWRPSAVIDGTPGAADMPTVPAPGAIVVNEVLAHSDTSPDWIELYNTTGSAIDVGGWFLSDNNSNLGKYVIPAGTSIGAGGYLVFYEDSSFGAGNPGTPFALSENGETVYLSSASGGVLTGFSEEEDFGASDPDVAFGRYFKASTGTYNFVGMTMNTPGAANASPAVGPIVISEFMYNPGGAEDPDFEYIELQNITASPVLLQDLGTGATWEMTDGVTYSFPAGVTIPANDRLILALDLAAFNATYPGVSVQVLEWDSGRLSNGGERVQIGKPGDVNGVGERQYIRVDRVNYDDTAPWPTSPDGAGDALQRIVAGDYGNDVANWQAGAATPGN